MIEKSKKLAGQKVSLVEIREGDDVLDSYVRSQHGGFEVVIHTEGGGTQVIKGYHDSSAEFLPGEAEP